MSNNSKVLRNYILQVDAPPFGVSGLDQQNTLQVPTVFIQSPKPYSMANPYTLEFDIVRNVTNSTSATFRIYNLSQKTRNTILRDTTSMTGWQPIYFYAGYGLPAQGQFPQSALPLVFSGYVSECTSTREGVNVITTISCFGFAAQEIASQAIGSIVSPNSNTSINTLIDTVIKRAGNVGLIKGLVGDFPGNAPNGQSYSGSIVEVINQIVNGIGVCFIDGNTINVLTRNMFVANPNFNVVSASTGLLSSPERRNYEITLHILFEPRVLLGQSLQVNSTVNTYLNNRNFKVSRISHRGVISPVVSGEATTTITMFDLVQDATDHQQVQAP